jgi:putative pyruvate formate lyase activating enzyme
MQPKHGKSVADRAVSAWEAMKNCHLCPRACGVDRTRGQKGYCGLSSEVRCFREMIYDGEEETLNPSHQVYFAGCNLRCGFCSVEEWNRQPDAAHLADMGALQKAVEKRRAQGARTLNLLGGEPAVSIHGVLKLLDGVADGTTVVWNSNMYYTATVAELLEGLVDVWLADLKCGNDRCASRLLDGDNYLAVAQENIRRALGCGRTIVRHVVMPGHLDCCTAPVLKWLGGLDGVEASLKFDYVPPAEEGASPGGYLSTEDAQKALELARLAGVVLIK